MLISSKLFAIAIYEKENICFGNLIKILNAFLPSVSLSRRRQRLDSSISYKSQSRSRNELLEILASSSEKAQFLVKLPSLSNLKTNYYATSRH